jgi:PHP domain
MENNPDNVILQIPLFIEHTRQGTYFTLSFTMPENIETLRLTYQYTRHRDTPIQVENGTFNSRQEVNIIDLGLIAPDGTQVGDSGSDKLSISISETSATAGYRPHALTPGDWRIIVGAYKVAEEGVDVHYELTFSPKYRRLFKGDLHTHTYGSDGVLALGELAQHAMRNGLDFLAITDHNQMVSTDTLVQVPGITLIPGVEWTHYQGHANFIGVDQPYDEPFLANSLEEVRARFASARQRGAFISINHPFDPVCPFLFDMNELTFDCLEIWNGPMRGSNLQAIGLWQNLLTAGKKVPICAGSDYHRDSLLLFPGGPTTCVYAMSDSPSDILTALKQGHAFLTYSVNGPMLEMTAGEAILGDSVDFTSKRQFNYQASGLVAGDVVQVVTPRGTIQVLKAETNGTMNGVYDMSTPGFAFIEILRSFLPGLPLLPAAISNPIYFDG